MARKAQVKPAKLCVCNKCGIEAVSIPGKKHRRCSGQEDNHTLKDKHSPWAHSGVWG